MDLSLYNRSALIRDNPQVFAVAADCRGKSSLRSKLIKLFSELELAASREAGQSITAIARIRDCGQALRNMLKKRSDELSGFSLAQVLLDLARDRPRPDLTPAFYADLYNILQGMQGRGSSMALEDLYVAPFDQLSGREAAIARSAQLDRLREEVDRRIELYPSGLGPEAVARRRRQSRRLRRLLGASETEWRDWRWQIGNIVKQPDLLAKLVRLTPAEDRAVREARRLGLPFGATPYYLSLMDDEPGGRDAAIRAQILPPLDYVRQMGANPDPATRDFMGEEDTSPFDLITRRYPGICILKPFNTCPQICVYCQRNWEIDDAMASGAFAGWDKIDAAIAWIGAHPGIHEVLVTGGDPLAMGDIAIGRVLEKLAAIPSVERIRIGTRTLVTMPMRVSRRLADLLGRYREPGRRVVAVVTHVQHPYEITPELVAAVDRLRRRGIPVYNQLVYTFFASRRFEAAALRRLLRLVGIDPYYTFNTKGKEETISYRVPVARLLQEQQEEARLLPGLERTDEAVFNVPRLGKNYLRSGVHRDLLTIKPDGSRVYEFYSWEKNISTAIRTYCTADVPILDYLQRLAAAGENGSDYDTIWYYF